MFENTKSAIDSVKKDINTIRWIVTYGMYLFMIIYYIFALVAKTGNFIANVILLFISALLLLVNSLYDIKRISKKIKKEKKSIQRVVRVCKHLVVACSLIKNLWDMYLNNEVVNPVSIIFTTFLIMIWVVNVLIELIGFIFEMETERIMNGVAKDFEWTSKATEFLNNQIEKTKDLVENTAGNIKEGFEKTTSKLKKFLEKDKTSENRE